MSNMLILNNNHQYDAAIKRRSFIVSLSAIMLSGGIFSNDLSYLFCIPLIFAAYDSKISTFSKERKSLITLTFSLVVYGSVRGYLAGHNIEYIVKFALPIFIFGVFCALPGLGWKLIYQNNFVISVGFLYTFVVLFEVKSGNFEYSNAYMRGWTITYSSNAAISIWNYFMVPFCVTALFIKYKRTYTRYLFESILAILILCMLLFLNETSAFIFALISVILIYFLYRIYFHGVFWLIWAIALLMIFDFFTFQFFSMAILGGAFRLGAEDAGDLLRSIQLEYFYQNVQVLGSGFGASHDFAFEIDRTRQVSQILYPYASELPIVNILFNGGALAAIWFSVVFLIFARLTVKSTDQSARIAQCFGIGCFGVIAGSLSNPFLFAPTSMLLLATAFDLMDTQKYALCTRT